MYLKKNKQFISKNINSNFFQNNNEPLIYHVWNELKYMHKMIILIYQKENISLNAFKYVGKSCVEIWLNYLKKQMQTSLAWRQTYNPWPRAVDPLISD